jgi:hypothetical protein
VHWGTGTAHLLPRLIRGRNQGLGYDRARVLLDRYTGWDLHQLRHSAATHLGEQASLCN